MDEENRLIVINEVIQKLKLLKDGISISKKDIDTEFISKHLDIINKLLEVFTCLKDDEVCLIYFSINFLKEKEIYNILNIFDIFNNLMDYLVNINPTEKNYNNNYIDDYLLKRYEFFDIFTNQLKKLGGRELKLDSNHYFNYLPIKCIDKSHINRQEDEDVKYCSFAHNDNEIYFHPLIYKKFKCYNSEHNEEEFLEDANNLKLCPFYHENEERATEIDFNSEIYINIMKALEYDLELDKNLQDMSLINNKNIENNIIATEFNPATYKIYKCPLGKLCKLNEKLCLNYHSKKDRRRNPILYTPKMCKDKENCKNYEKCKFCHNVYEYCYHPEKFRKTQCKQELTDPDDICKTRLICPYLHKSDMQCEIKNNVIVDPVLIGNYYSYKLKCYYDSQNNYIDKITKNSQKFLCPECLRNNVLKDQNFYVFKEKKNDFYIIMCAHCYEVKKDYFKNKNIEEICIKHA